MPTMRRAHLGVALAVLSIVGCGVPPTATESISSGHIVLADWQAPDTLNPYYALRVVDYTAAQLAFTPLFWTRRDFTREPALLSEIPLTTNGGVATSGNTMDVTWRFREGMRWSDGSPIGCDDLIATWRWIMDRANAGLAMGTAGWAIISSIDGAGSTTCRTHFTQVYEGYLGFVSGLLPARYLATVPVAESHVSLYPMSDPLSGVYSGPFIPERVAGDQIDYRANPYWRTISGHDPRLDRVTLKSFGTAATMVAAYRSGDVDVAQDLGDTDFGLVADVAPSEVLSGRSLSYELLSLNDAAFERRFGDDHEVVKRAISLAVDRPQIALGILGGSVSPIANFVPGEAWYFKDEGTPSAADPDAARRLLDGAGWLPGADGTRRKGGTRLSLDLCTNPLQARIDTLTLVASGLKAIGIDAAIRIEPSTAIGGGWADVPPDTPCNLAHGNFDIAEFAFSSPADPAYAYATYHSSAIPNGNPQHSGFNVTRTSIPEMDAALETASGSVDAEAIKAAMATVQDLYVQNTIEIPLYARTQIALRRSALRGVDPAARWDGIAWNIGDWSLDG